MLLSKHSNVEIRYCFYSRDDGFSQGFSTKDSVDNNINEVREVSNSNQQDILKQLHNSIFDSLGSVDEEVKMRNKNASSGSITSMSETEGLLSFKSDNEDLFKDFHSSGLDSPKGGSLSDLFDSMEKEEQEVIHTGVPLNNNGDLGNIFDTFRQTPTEAHNKFLKEYNEKEVESEDIEDGILLGSTPIKQSVTLNDGPLLSAHHSLTEQVGFGEELDEFDVISYLEEVIEELQSKVYRFNSIKQMIISSPKEHALKFIKTTLQDNLKSFGNSLVIEPLVEPPSDEESILHLFEFLNLKANIVNSESRKSKFQSDLKEHHREVMENIKSEKDKIIDIINTNKPELEKELSNRYSNESSTLANDEQHLLNLIKKAEELSVQYELSSNKDLFEETEEFSLIVNDLKERIVNVLGKRFIQNSSDTFEIPRNREELEDLLEQVEDIANKTEINNVTIYDKVGFKLLRFLYTPTRFTKGDMRTIIGLINTLIVILVAVKFKNLAVGAFVFSVAYDLFNQVRLASKNSDISLLADFVKNSDRIINDLKTSIAHEKREETKELSVPYANDIKNHFDKAREELMELYEIKLEEIESIDDDDKIIELIQNHYRELNSQLQGKIKTIYTDYALSLTEFVEQLEGKLSAKEREIRDNKNLDIYADVNLGNTVYKPTYKVARINIPDTDLGIDFERHLDEGSYLIKCKGIEEKEKIANFIKLLILQQQTHLKPGHAILNVFDIEQAGAHFMDMYSSEEELYNLYSRSDKVDEKLENLVYDISSRHNIALKHYDSLTEYNKDAPNKLLKPFPYIINFWYNIPKEIASKVSFQTIIREGKKAGMLNIHIMDEEKFIDMKGELEENLIYDYDKNFDYVIQKKPIEGWYLYHNLATTTRQGPMFHKIDFLETKRIEYNKNKVVEKSQNLDKFLEDTKTQSILYKDLEEQYAKTLFTKDTLTGIDICVGFRDGDINKPDYVRLDDELVHCLMAGKTGAGKSNTINVVLMNLLRNYSPEWLELYMIDFKNVEFNFYTHEQDFGSFKKKVSLVPHSSMIAGTTDPEYALSVFSQALKEMERRKKLIAKGINGEVFKKIESYNRYLLEHDLVGKFYDLGNGKQGQYKILPRILILLDEFQVMFKMEDADKLQKIKDMIERLSREARSMGIHMFFTSQSMDGTLKGDVLNQFAMRFCLSTDADTSKFVLGNDASSKLKGKGWIYMSGTGQRLPEDNKLFKVPFIPEKYNKEALLRVRNACIELNKNKPYIPAHQIDFYDEADRHNSTELKEWLSHPSVKKNRHAVLLGHKVVYRSYSNPENSIINNSDTENILVTANDKVALANILNTLTANYSSKERTRVVVLNCDRNLDGMLKEEFIDKDYIHLLNSNNIVPFIEGLNNDIIGPANDVDPSVPKEKTALERMNEIFNGPADEDDDDYIPDKFDPNIHSRWVVVIVGLHKAEGFNEDYVDDKFMQPLQHMLKYGPLQGVTTILNYKTPFKARKILPQFSHRISARVDDDISFELFNNRSATQLYNDDGLNFATYLNAISGDSFKFKCFEFHYDKSLLSVKKIQGLSLVV